MDSDEKDIWRAIAVWTVAIVLFMVLLVFANVRYHQGKAEGYSDGYRQALKEFHIGHIE